jgi:hypothetical protein
VFRKVTPASASHSRGANSANRDRNAHHDHAGVLLGIRTYAGGSKGWLCSPKVLSGLHSLRLFARSAGVPAVILKSFLDNARVEIFNAKQSGYKQKVSFSMIATNHVEKNLAAALLLVALLTSPSVAQAQSAQPSQTCFEIVTVRDRDQPASAMLLNKCNGETWILMRRYQRPANGNPGQLLYRWSAVATDSADRRSRADEPAAATSDKCFVFQGRRFCE